MTSPLTTPSTTLFGSLVDRTAWVTGGSSGIGRATAQLLASRGAKVGVLDLAPSDDGFESVRCDVSDSESMTSAADELARIVGPADVLVCSAGVNAAQPLEGHPVDLWERVIGINLTGTFHAIRVCLPGMIEREWGRIVTLSSGGGVRVLPGKAAYGASKAGVINLTKAAAQEGAQHGVTANVIAPGMTDTPMAAAFYDGAASEAVKTRNVANPMGVLLDPIDIAHGVAFLCSPEARYITGQVLHVNAGSVM